MKWAPKNSVAVVGTLAFVALVSVGLFAQTSRTADVAFKAARHIEEVEGNLRGAIDAYAKLAQGSDRAIAAQALVRMAGCYEKLGEPDAREVYQRVLRDYADQLEQSREARVRLSSLANTLEDRAGAAQDPALRKLPDTRNVELFSLSPDGSKMAFTDFGPGQNVFVHDYASNRMINVTKLTWGRGDEWTLGPIWSRDGEQLAYTQSGAGEIEIRITTLDGSSRLLYRNEGFPIPTDWLPDGSAVVGVVQHPDKTYTLGLFPLEGGSFVPLRSLEWNFDYDGLPNASPDGRFIVFADGPQDAADIHIVGVDGQSLTVLTDHPAADVQPRWSPDGKHIVFLSRRHQGQALWGIPVENGTAAGEPFLIKSGMTGTTLLNWTPAGLAYTNPIGFTDVFTMPIDPNTGRATGPPVQIAYPETGSNGDNGGVAWSPDGSRLAFFKQRGYVVVTNADGKDAREFEMPPARGYPQYLRWLHDGSGLSYVSPNDREVVTLFRVMLDTGEWESYPFPVRGRRPYDWSRDGDSFYYSSPQHRTPLRIIEHELASGRERIVFSSDDASSPIDDDSGLVGFPALRISRDFKKLAFVAWGYGPPAGVWLLDLETGKVRIVKVDPTGALYRGVSWSPDGRHLVCSLVGSPDLEVISVEDGRSHRITFEPGDIPSVDDGFMSGSPRWSPVGDRLAFAARSEGLEVWLMQEVIPTRDEDREPSARR